MERKKREEAINREKYLTFNINNIVSEEERKENYGIPITQVQEIMGMLEFTTIPNTPDHVKGVINLRGQIITLIDLRLKLGFEEIEYNDRTCIIIVELVREKGKKVMGFVVDMVSEVIDIADNQIEEFSQEEVDVSKKVIDKIAKLEDKIIMLLNLEKLIGKKDLKIAKDIKETENIEENN